MTAATASQSFASMVVAVVGFMVEDMAVVAVGLPDQATYDYLDQMYENDFGKWQEISDRTVAAWAKASEAKSFDANPRAREGAESSNDQPAIFTGVAALDNFAATKILLNVAVCLKRSVVIAGVEQNLLAPKREEILKKSINNFSKKR